MELCQGTLQWTCISPRRLGLEVLLVASLTETAAQTTLEATRLKGNLLCPLICTPAPNVPHTEIMKMINDHALIGRIDNYSKSSVLC